MRDYAVIGSEAINHGVQIFDMKKLLDIDGSEPVNFTQEDLTGHWGLSDDWNALPVGRTHNIVVNEELNYAVAVGSVGGNETIRVRGDLPCRGGLIYIDIATQVTLRALAAQPQMDTSMMPNASFTADQTKNTMGATFAMATTKTLLPSTT